MTHYRQPANNFYDTKSSESKPLRDKRPTSPPSKVTWNHFTSAQLTSCHLSSLQMMSHNFMLANATRSGQMWFEVTWTNMRQSDMTWSECHIVGRRHEEACNSIDSLLKTHELCVLVPQCKTNIKLICICNIWFEHRTCFLCLRSMSPQSAPIQSITSQFLDSRWHLTNTKQNKHICTNINTYP